MPLLQQIGLIPLAAQAGQLRPLPPMMLFLTLIQMFFYWLLQ
jgi:hypothetical protein